MQAATPPLLRRMSLRALAAGMCLVFGGGALDLFLIGRVWLVSKGEFASFQDLQAAVAGPVALQVHVAAVTLWTRRAGFTLILVSVLTALISKRRRDMQRAG